MAKKNGRIQYENEALGCKFSLPAILTVRKQIEYQERIWSSGGDSSTLQFWDGSIPIIEDWECEKIPDPDKLNIDEETDGDITSIVIWVANQAADYFLEKEYVPKNV